MSALFVVSTPIGNLEDITFRAIRVLKEVKVIAAEDTRKTRILLNKYAIKTPTTSYHEHNKLTKLEYILDLLESEDVALVSDAGTPGISDPGYELITAVIQRHKQVIPIPGPSVLVSALVVSGLPTDSFCYIGFLPHRSGDRRKLLLSKVAEKSSLVLFESPHRLSASLHDILDIFGDRPCAICRELTKVHEDIFRGSISTAINHYVNPKGEFTLVISGAGPAVGLDNTTDVEKDLKKMIKEGFTARDALSYMSTESGLSRKALYSKWLKIQKE
jgi:16S rRNA (cytidine1402-2'-O)-methyltransferase